MKPVYFIFIILSVMLSSCATITPSPQLVYPTINPASNYSGDNNETYSGSGGDTSWFTGGTLHRSTIGEWRAASYRNRLATAADFVAATQNVDFGDLDSFKQMATDLEICISTTAEGGYADDEQTAFISALCTVQLFP